MRESSKLVPRDFKIAFEFDDFDNLIYVLMFVTVSCTEPRVSISIKFTGHLAAGYGAPKQLQKSTINHLLFPKSHAQGYIT